MSLKDKFNEERKSEHAAQGGNWFKFKEGDNKIRILTEPVAIYEDYKLGMCYTDCRFKGNMKYLSYIYDYGDNAVKLMKLPLGVFQYIADLEMDEDWKFDAFPMPYGLNVKALGAATKEVKYSPVASPKKSEIPQTVIDQISKKKPVIDVIAGIKKSNEEKHKKDGTWERFHSDTDLEKPDEVEAPEGEIDF